MMLDTSAWIELFQKSAEGKRVAEILNSEECHTSMATLAEICDWAIRNKRDPEPMIRDVHGSAEVVPLEEQIVILAGELNPARKAKAKNWGMMDSFILATGQMYGLMILTKDSHFKDLENVEMLK